MPEQEGAFPDEVLPTQEGTSQEEAAPQQEDVPQQELPIDWPEDIEYLRRPKISPAVPAIALKILNTPTAATASFTRFSADALSFPNPDVRIVPLNDPDHPANGQYGLAAMKHFHPGNFILPYIGRLHTNKPEDTDPDSEYDISLDRDLDLAQDAAKSGNEARFINDYRNIADAPNAEFRDIWVQTAEKKWERWIGIFTVTTGKSGMRRNGIRPGEEILVSYGKGFWKDKKDEWVAPKKKYPTQEKHGNVRRARVRK
ncbi:hypothetical protein KCU81_g1201, partial [Aureobasidium melanogenum]|uniref:SET domain-containing protein n=1 Tax=Aureobasidium melanogenum (strain CBS 110374) TaxID=1043003 RepID=A0A074WW29_AURM1